MHLSYALSCVGPWSLFPGSLGRGLTCISQGPEGLGPSRPIPVGFVWQGYDGVRGQGTGGGVPAGLGSVPGWRCAECSACDKPPRNLKEKGISTWEQREGNQGLGLAPCWDQVERAWGDGIMSGPSEDGGAGLGCEQWLGHKVCLLAMLGSCPPEMGAGWAQVMTSQAGDLQAV